MDMNYLKQAGERVGRAMALKYDFDMWFLTLEEHYKRGIEAHIEKRMIEKKPWYIPSQLWSRWIQ